MKDKSAKNWRLRKIYYRVGSYFKGCRNCGQTVEIEMSPGKYVKRYLSGYDVYRSYDPKFVGWTWWCYTCGAKDLKCWEPDTSGMVEHELGNPPVQGCRDVKYAKKQNTRKMLAGSTSSKGPEKLPADPEIQKIKDEIARLKELVAKGGK